MHLFDYLPITVISAIVLFIVKETVENRRRKLADRRKKQALRKLLARECEMNHWAIKTLRFTAKAIQSQLEEDENCQISVESQSGDKYYLRIRDSQNVLVAGLPLAAPKREVMEKNLLDVATLDAKLFYVLEQAYDAVAELQNARDRILTTVETDIEEEQDHIHGMDEFILRTADAAYDRLNALYLECTGKNLEVHRLR